MARQTHGDAAVLVPKLARSRSPALRAPSPAGGAAARPLASPGADDLTPPACLLCPLETLSAGSHSRPCSPLPLPHPKPLPSLTWVLQQPS